MSDTKKEWKGGEASSNSKKIKKDRINVGEKVIEKKKEKEKYNTSRKRGLRWSWGGKKKRKERRG